MARGEVKEMRQVVIYPGEDGYWVAECPSLPGCVSQGKTKEEAIANIKEAIKDTSQVLKKISYLYPRNTLKHCFWQYEQPSAAFRSRMHNVFYDPKSPSTAF